MIEPKVWSRERFPVVYEGGEAKAVLVDIDVFEQIEMILENLFNRESEPEEAIVAASNLLPQLIARAQNTEPAETWEQTLDEL